MPAPSRYARQETLPEIGAEGQRLLASGRALIVGIGALGCVSADILARAGVGRVTLLDRDIVELSNLQRQPLFTEADAAEGLPKALAGARHLRDANTEIEIRAEVVDLTASNAERLFVDALGPLSTLQQAMTGPGVLPLRNAVVLDGTDNFETRFLLNDLSVKHGVPFIYAGVVGTRATLATFMPGGPCLRCLLDGPPPPGSQETCETAGVFAPASMIAGSHQAAQAIKFLAGHAVGVDNHLTEIDAWTGETRRIALPPKRPDCPACALARFDFLNAVGGDETILCGRKAVQVTPRGVHAIDLPTLAKRLAPHGSIHLSAHLLRAAIEGIELTVFPDGRAIIKGTDRSEVARAVYARWVGV